VAHVGPNCEEDCVGLERLSGGGTTDSAAVLQTSVLCDLDIRAGRDAGKLFTDYVSELSHVLAVEALSTHSFPLPAPGALFGVGF
jgi:hypothetical protein